MAAILFRSPRLSSARFADKPEDFAKLGIQPGRIEAFEDGMGEPRADRAATSGGTLIPTCTTARLVIVFYTKPQLNPDGELAPFASLEPAGVNRRASGTAGIK